MERGRRLSGEGHNLAPVRLGARTETLDGTHFVVAEGEVDLAGAHRLSRALGEVLAAREGDVVVDLCAVSFMDSFGIGKLLETLQRLRRQGRRMAVVCPPGAVRRVLELARLEEALQVQETREQAQAALG